MLPKNEAKYIQSLHHKKFRHQHAAFIAEGPKVVGELIARRLPWVQNLYGTAAWRQMQPPEVWQNIASRFIEIESWELEKISALQTPQQVLAVASLPSFTYEKAPGWLVALDGIQDPGNLGTIIRTAHWFGIQQVLCSPDCAEAFSPKVVQASMGSVFGVGVVYQELASFFHTYDEPVYGALLDGRAIAEITKAKSGCLVIGNEGKGIRPEVLPYISQKLTISGAGDAESLNAAVAAGILMHWAAG